MSTTNQPTIIHKAQPILGAEFGGLSGRLNKGLCYTTIPAALLAAYLGANGDTTPQEQVPLLPATAISLTGEFALQHTDWIVATSGYPAKAVQGTLRLSEELGGVTSFISSKNTLIPLITPTDTPDQTRS